MIHLLEARREVNWWPLTEEGTFSSEQFVAGVTLRNLQERYAPEGASVTENAWISREDWEVLDRAENASLVDSDGAVLGYMGDGSGDTIEAQTSFLILYSWDVLKVNEQVVSSLECNEVLGEVSSAAHIEGVIHVGKGTRILPGVFIEGNVVIGENCKIGPNCYIRGNTAIGNDVHIGQAVEVKNSIIGHGSAVGHLSYVGDSILGSGVNFGAATITSNYRHDGSSHWSEIDGKRIDTGRIKFGTIVGDGVHTGIHTAIYPGRKLGPNTTTRPNDSVEKDLLDPV